MGQVARQPQEASTLALPAQAPKIGVLVVAYNAATTIAEVLDRVPQAFRPRISQVFVRDDASQDSTYLVGLGYQKTNDDLPLTVIRHPRTSATAATRRPATAWLRSTASTSSSCCKGMGSTRRNASRR